MLDLDLLHRKVPWIARSENRGEPVRRCRDQAVGLRQCQSTRSEEPPPFTGLPALFPPERSDTETVEEMLGRSELGRTQPSKDLFDIDRGRAGHVSPVEKHSDAIDGGAAAQIVDQHARVQHDEHWSTHAPRVSETLTSHPGGGIGVPFVFGVSKNAGRLVEPTPATLALHGSAHRIPNERAPAARSGDSVDLVHERVLEFYVHSHVRSHDT